MHSLQFFNILSMNLIDLLIADIFTRIVRISLDTPSHNIDNIQIQWQKYA